MPYRPNGTKTAQSELAGQSLSMLSNIHIFVVLSLLAPAALAQELTATCTMDGTNGAGNNNDNKFPVIHPC